MFWDCYSHVFFSRHRKVCMEEKLWLCKICGKGWRRNNLWLKMYIQWKSKSSDAFIFGQCNSVSMATSPWVFRIAALHLNLVLFLFLWYRNHNHISVIRQANMQCWTLMKLLCWQHRLILRRISSEIWKAHGGVTVPQSACQNRCYSRERIKLNIYEAWCLLVKKLPNSPNQCCCCFLLCVEKKHCLEVKILSTAD